MKLIDWWASVRDEDPTEDTSEYLKKYGITEKEFVAFITDSGSANMAELGAGFIIALDFLYTRDASKGKD